MFFQLKRWISYFFIFSMGLVLAACNDSNDKQAVDTDHNKKPVMRCAR